MLVNNTIETPEGTVKFEGELSQAELNLVVQLGLHALLQAGVLNHTIVGDVDPISLQQLND